MSDTRLASGPESGFDRFALDGRLQRGLAAAGFSNPRPIQCDTIPSGLEGRDVMGLAQTGTGKTAAFALPILHRLLQRRGAGPRVLVLAPTRELALQIETEIRLLAKFTKISTMTVFGGVPIRTQIRALRRQPEIVVGCPGRTLDLLRQRELDLSRIDTLVLDEADHMFDLGFLPDIRRILAALPASRQNLLFSATMPKGIRELAEGILRDPHVVEREHNTAPAAQVEHALCPVSQDRKQALLECVLDAEDCKTAIVFTRTKHRAKRLALQLDRGGHRAVALQGNMTQSQRDKAMRGFRDGRFDILVATDIAARGLDVADVDYVINFDPPSTAETYTHRIGRTGRSEASGRARTFVTHEDADWVRSTERVLGSRIPELRLPGFENERGHATGARRSSGGSRSQASSRPRRSRGSSSGKRGGRRQGAQAR